ALEPFARRSRRTAPPSSHATDLRASKPLPHDAADQLLISFRRVSDSSSSSSRYRRSSLANPPGAPLLGSRESPQVANPFALRAKHVAATPLPAARRPSSGWARARREHPSPPQSIPGAFAPSAPGPLGGARFPKSRRPTVPFGQWPVFQSRVFGLEGG